MGKQRNYVQDLKKCMRNENRDCYLQDMRKEWAIVKIAHMNFLGEFRLNKCKAKVICCLLQYRDEQIFESEIIKVIFSL